jgi:hypothetical protein
MAQPVSLETFGLSKEFGYMQHSDPVASLSAANAAWDELVQVRSHATFHHENDSRSEFSEIYNRFVIYIRYQDIV